MISKFVSGFESITGQSQAIRILTGYLSRGTIPHAFLFVGMAGVGKKTTAMAFAMACNCPDIDSGPFDRENEGPHPEARQKRINPCGRCRSCRKILSGNHPDFIHIKPSGPYIKIAQVRALLNTLTVKPYEAARRVVLLSEAQAMNTEAANALLKVLEEPPPETILILTARQGSDLLPTVTSRCQHIKFNPLSTAALEKLLTENHGLEPKEAELLAIVGNGSYTRASSMIDSEWLQHREWLLEASGLSQPQNLPSRPVFQLLAFAEKLARNKEIVPDSLEILNSWLRDLIVFQFSPEKIINRDLTAEIQSASGEISPKWLLSKIDVIQKTQRVLQFNANLRLTLEMMMLNLAAQ